MIKPLKLQNNLIQSKILMKIISFLYNKALRNHLNKNKSNLKYHLNWIQFGLKKNIS